MAKTQRKKINTRRNNKWKWVNSAIVIALIGVLGGIITTLINKAVPDNSSSHLTAEAANIESDSVSSGVNSLDFQLRNLGSQIAIINGIRINVLELTEDCGEHEYLPPSAVYGVILPLQVGKSVFANLHDSVEPNNADRFDVRLALPATADGNALYYYVLQLTIFYNNNKTLKAGNKDIELRAAQNELQITHAAGSQPYCS